MFETIFTYLFRLFLPLFRKSDRLKKLTLENIEKFTEIRPLRRENFYVRNEHAYAIFRFENLLKSKLSEGSFWEPAKTATGISRIAVVTALFGSRSKPINQLEFITGCDYFYMSDKEELLSHPWTKLNEPIPDQHQYSDVSRARWVKTSLLDLVPDYEVIIWLDGNILVTSDFSELVEKLDNSEADFMAYPHGDRTSVLDEASAIEKLGKEKNMELLNTQISRYSDAVLLDSGLYETGVMFLKNNQKTKKMMSIWQSEIAIYSLRDQVSLPYAIDQSEVEAAPLSTNGATIRSNPYFVVVDHYVDDFPARRFNFLDMTSRVSLSNRNLDASQAPNTRKLQSKLLSVVIPVFNSPEQVKMLVKSLESEILNCPWKVEVIFVDDASRSETKDLLKDFSNMYEWANLVLNERNSKFPTSANTGVDASNGEFCIIINSDVILPGNLLENFVQAWWDSPEIGILGALSNNAGYQTVVPTQDSSSWRKLGHKGVSDLAKDFEKIFGKGATLDFPQIHGSLFGVKKELFERLGGFDIRNFEDGYGEEVDFCLRARRVATPMNLCISSVYHHFGSASYSAEFKMRQISSAKLKLSKIHGNHYEDLKNELVQIEEIEKIRLIAKALLGP